MGTGILTPIQESALATWIDTLLGLKGVVGIVTGYAIKIVISFLDNTLVDKLSVAIKTQLSEIINSILDDKLNEAEKLCGDLASDLNKYATDTTQKLAFKAGITLGLAGCTHKLDEMSNKSIVLKLKK
jgi:uncharacterized membrane protein (Fun14 family)